MRLVGRLMPEKQVVGLRENGVVGILAEEVGKCIFVTQDDVQREPSETDGAPRSAAAGQGLLDPRFRRASAGDGRVNAGVEAANDFFLFLGPERSDLVLRTNGRRDWLSHVPI